MIALSLILRMPPHSIEKPVPWTGVPGVMTHSPSALERLPGHWIIGEEQGKRMWERWGGGGGRVG